MEMSEEAVQDPPTSPTSPRAPSIKSFSGIPVHKRTRSQSAGDFPPPMRRTSTDASGAPRPVPFAAKFQRVHPGTTGVTVLEHLERLDAVEASLQRLETDDTLDDDEEVDVGVSTAKKPVFSAAQAQASTSAMPTSPFSPPGSPLPVVQEVPSANDSGDEDEEDLVALSKSTSHVEGVNIFGPLSERVSSTGIDWIQNGDAPPKRIVITEVCATLPVNRVPVLH
jgi:phosphatidylinositol 4-kinase type 2